MCYTMFNLYMLYRLTPLYQAIECGGLTATLTNFGISEGLLDVVLISEMRCTNFNSYEVQVRSSQPGRVFVFDSLSTLGRFTLVDGSTVPAHSSGLVRARMHARLSRHGSESMIVHYLSGKELPFFMELHLDVGINLNFGLTHFDAMIPIRKKCGMNMAGHPRGDEGNRLGPVTCRDTFEGLAQDMSSAPDSSEALSFRMDPGLIGLGEKIKNVSTIGLGCVSYILGLVLFWKSSRSGPPVRPSEVVDDAQGSYLQVDWPVSELLREKTTASREATTGHDSIARTGSTGYWPMLWQTPAPSLQATQEDEAPEEDCGQTAFDAVVADGSGIAHLWSAIWKVLTESPRHDGCDDGRADHHLNNGAHRPSNRMWWDFWNFAPVICSSRSASEEHA